MKTLFAIVPFSLGLLMTGSLTGLAAQRPLSTRTTDDDQQPVASARAFTGRTIRSWSAYSPRAAETSGPPIPSLKQT